jgi:hypothetical protein
VVDLKIDDVALDSIVRSLSQINAEFEDLHVRRDTDEAIWGGHQVRSAMGAFASNWDVHREALSEQLRELGEKCSGVAETFRAVEELLSRATTRQGPQ